MYNILVLLLTLFALSSPAAADIKECGTYPTIYTNQSCARYANTTAYRVCIYSIEKPSVKRMQYVTGDMICLDPGSEKKLISRYITTTGIFTYGGKPVEVDILYHPREEKNRYAWFPLSGVKSCIKVSKNGAGYLQEFGGYDYDPEDKCSDQSVFAFSGDYVIAMQNAAKLDDGTGGGGVIVTPPPEKSDEEKEVDRLKQQIEDAKKINDELRAKIERCSFDSLQKVLDQDLGVIDYNEVMKTVLNCDDGLNDKVKSAKEKKDELDAIVKQIQKSLREEFVPKNRDRFIALGAHSPFSNDYESLGLNGLYMKNAYVFGVEKNTFFVELAGRYIDDFFNASISQKNEFLFRGTSSAWGESFAFYPDDLLPTNVQTDKKIDYAASVFKVRDRLINAETVFEKKLNRYGYEEDSPVPEEVQASILQNIVARHPDEGKTIENGLKSWKGPLSSHQENLLVSIESLAHLYDASGEDPASDYDTLKKIAKGLGEAAVDFAKCAARGGLTDAADWYEIATGKEWCGDGDITITGRLVSAAGLIGGSSKVWRKVAELAGLSVRVAKKGTKKVFDLAAEVVEKARQYRITRKGVKVYAKMHESLKTLPFGMTAKQIREGVNPDKIAIIGRSMGAKNGSTVGVYAAAHHFEKAGLGKVEKMSFTPDDKTWEEFMQTVQKYRDDLDDQTAMLPPEIVRTTKAWADNKEWAEKLAREGYTVVDLGNPANDPLFSAFYQVELDTLF